MIFIKALVSLAAIAVAAAAVYALSLRRGRWVFF